MIKILIVEDEKPISDLIRLSLGKSGYDCDCAFDGMSAADMLDENIYDLVLLDIMLPEVDGFELLEYIKPLCIPVIFITAKGSVNDRVRGLRMGAEDYIVKPFEVLELQARVDVVLRRYSKTESVISIGDLTIDTDAMQVIRSGEAVPLTRKEYDLLLLLRAIPVLRCIARPYTSECGAETIYADQKQLISTFSVCAKRSAGSTSSLP